MEQRLAVVHGVTGPCGVAGTMRGSTRGRPLVKIIMAHDVPPLPADLFWERTIADKFGVSRTRLREMRGNLTPETDWRWHNNAVVLTAAGLAKIERALVGEDSARNGAPRPADATGGPAAVPPGPAPTRRFVIVRVPVHRIDAPQKKIVLARIVPAHFAACSAWDLPKQLARHGHDTRDLAVRVRDNTNFRPGMIIEAAAVGLGMWQFLGRLPRRPGKW